MRVPSGVWHEGHESVRTIDMTPVHASDAMQLNLHVHTKKTLETLANPKIVTTRNAAKKNNKKNTTHSEVVEVVGLDLIQDAVLNGVAGRVKERVGDPDIPFHLMLLVHIDANHALVDAQQVDDRVILVHENIGTCRDLHSQCQNIV